MKINELLEKIESKEFNLKNELQVKTYLPIEAKKAIAQGIMYNCTTEEFGVIKVDSFARYMSYVRHMIVTHTNLEYTDADYDALCSTEYNSTSLLNAIIECFDNDAQECSRILDLLMNDYMQEMTIEFNVAKFLNSLNEFIGGLANKIGGVDLQSMLPESVDMNKLGDFLQNYIK